MNIISTLSKTITTLLFLGFGGATAAQEITFECKQTDGWKYQPNKERPPADALPGRCDANGLLQGDAFADLGDSYRLRSNFVDGRPRGASAIRRGVGGSMCLLNFNSEGNIEGDISCALDDHGYPDLSKVPHLNAVLSSATGFQLATERNGKKSLSAKNISYSAKGYFTLEIGGRRSGVTGEITGLTEFVKQPLKDLFKTRISNSRLTVTGLGHMENNRSAWAKSVTGPLLAGASTSIDENHEFTKKSSQKPTEKLNYPAELEITVEYVDGSWFKGVRATHGMSNEYVYYEDSRGNQFNGLIDECFQDRRGAGRLRLAGDHRSTGPSQSMAPAGCGSYKTATSAEVRGVFTGTSVKPF